MSYIDSKVARERLASMSAGDLANIFNSDAQKPFGIQSVVLDLTIERLESNPYQINFPFKSIYVQSTSDSSVSTNFKPNTQDSFQSAIKLDQNFCINFQDPVSSGNLFWSAQSGKSITIIFLVSGEVRPGKIVSVTSGGLTVSEGTSFSNSIVTLAANTPGIVAASNSTRSVSTIQNNTGGPIWFGPLTVSNTGANLGFQVGIGQNFIWKNTAVLYAVSVGGGDVLILNEVQ